MPFLKEKHHNWKGCGDISGTMYFKLKNNAWRRKIEFNISIEYLWMLFLKQGRKCNLTGWPLYILPKKNASIDRIDSSKGYIEGNVQWVHKMVNISKWKFSQEYFIKTCLEVYKSNREK